MIELDNDTQSSIINKFGMGGNDNVIASRETITQLSNSFTALQNALIAIQTHSGNIKKIQKAVIQGTKVESAETRLENPAAQLESGASAAGGGAGGIEALLPQITQALEQLGKSVEQLDLSAQSQPAGGMGIGRGRGPSLKTIGKIGLGVAAAGAVGYGAYSLMSDDEEEKPKPKPSKAPPAPAPTPLAPSPAPASAKLSSPAAEQSKSEKATLKAIDNAGKKKIAEKEAAPQLTPNAKSYTDGLLATIQGGVQGAGNKARTSQQAMATPVGEETSSGGDGGDGGGIEDGGGSAPTGGRAGDMEAAINKAGIKDKTVKAQMMAQAAHESGNFKYTQELGDAKYFEKYNGRKDLGNTRPGDGPRYRGRGFLQVTGRANYGEMSKELGVNFVEKPEALAEPKYAAASAVKWFQKRWMRFKDWGNTKAVTKVVNGGYNGLADREQKFAQYSKLYGSGGSAGAASASGANVGGFGGGASGGGSKGTGGKDIKNTDNINQSIKGKNIWDYARKNGSDVDYDGLKPGMKNRFLAMAIEYKQKTGSKIAINSANRTYAKQAAIFKQMGPRRAAPPGRSKHESGVAIDINSTDGNAAHKMGLLKKYGFFRPYPSEAWHVEPIEAAKVKGQTDNPYNPGSPIAQTGKGNKPVIQNDSGQTKRVTEPSRQLGPPSEGVAIQQNVGGRQVATTVVPVPVGGSGPTPGPAQYLAGIPSAKRPSPQSRNPVQEYRAYFNAA